LGQNAGRKAGEWLFGPDRPSAAPGSPGAEVNGKILIEVNEGHVSAVRARTENPFVLMDVNTGYMQLSN
jgi:hypothetical protein